jgi:hypothetical protein
MPTCGQTASRSTGPTCSAGRVWTTRWSPQPLPCPTSGTSQFLSQGSPGHVPGRPSAALPGYRYTFPRPWKTYQRKGVHLAAHHTPTLRSALWHAFQQHTRGTRPLPVRPNHRPRSFEVPQIQHRFPAPLVQRAGRVHPLPIFAGSPWRERDLARATARRGRRRRKRRHSVRESQAFKMLTRVNNTPATLHS